MSVNDKVLDEITGHSVDLLRVDAGLRKDVLRELKVLERDLVGQLEKARLHEIKRTPFQRRRMEKMLKQTRKTIRSTYRKIDRLEDKQLAGMAQVAEMQAVGSINTAIGAEVLSVGMSREMLEAIGRDTLIEGAPSKEWWGRQAGGLELKFKDNVRQGLLSGKTTGQIVQGIRGTRVNKYKDGIMHASRKQAEALVRTSVQVVANEARMQTYANNDDIVKGVEWVSTLDGRTSSICRSLDGLMWNNERKPIKHSRKFPGPTAHWNCRSTQVPVLKSWEELGAKRKFKEIPESTRASMDGQVSAKVGYEDWLGSKSEAFQKEVLGKGKWELWKAGKVGFTDLVDQTGNPVSLGVLREKLGVKVKEPAVSKRKGFDTDKDALRQIKYEAELIAPPSHEFGHSDLTEAEEISLTLYSSQYHGHVNRYLRGTYDFKRGKTKEMLDTSVSGMDSAFRQIGKKGSKKKIYRGLHAKSETAKSLRKGSKTLTDKGFTSATLDKSVAETYAYDGLVLEIDASKVRSVDMEAEGLSFVTGEREVLLDRGLSFDVEKVSDNYFKLIAKYL